MRAGGPRFRRWFVSERPEPELLTRAPSGVENVFPGAYAGAMPETVAPAIVPDLDRDVESRAKDTREPGYLVVCWNDPVNLMVYVTHVFQVVFGWPRQKAERHMLQVHNQGKSILTRESLERAEFYVHQLQKYGLHATLERDEL
jgi:ATP-dependent Clp protease adaptor protein ClpS